MEKDHIDPAKMTLADLFRAKAERRQRLAHLPFEAKIEIVKRLQSVSRTARGVPDVRQRPDSKSPK